MVLYKEGPTFSSGTVDVAFIRARDKEEATERAVESRAHPWETAAQVRQRIEVLGEGEFGQVVHIPTTYSDY